MVAMPLLDPRRPLQFHNSTRRHHHHHQLSSPTFRHKNARQRGRVVVFSLYPLLDLKVKIARFCPAVSTSVSISLAVRSTTCIGADQFVIVAIIILSPTIVHLIFSQISSPADPTLLYFKLNKLQQAQNSHSYSASVSPQPSQQSSNNPISPSPILQPPPPAPASVALCGMDIAYPLLPLHGGRGRRGPGGAAR